MSASDTVSGANLEAKAAAAPAPKTRPFYWSLRCELWGNPSIYIAPLATAGVVLFGSAVSSVNLGRLLAEPKVRADMLHARPDQLVNAAAAPFAIAAFVIMVAAFVTGFFYCLSALRSDRTVLFWKSLPVSDLTAVLAKLTVPMLVLQIVTFVVGVATMAVIEAIAMVVLPATGPISRATLWSSFPLPTAIAVFGYLLVCMTLWTAPVWGWLLMVSAWAKRVPFLWAAGAPLALCVFEGLAFHTNYVWSWAVDRLAGPMAMGRPLAKALDIPTGVRQTDLSVSQVQLDPLQFLAQPALWIGLVVAALFVAAAVWLRRRREPI